MNLIKESGWHAIMYAMRLFVQQHRAAGGVFRRGRKCECTAVRLTSCQRTAPCWLLSSESRCTMVRSSKGRRLHIDSRSIDTIPKTIARYIHGICTLSHVSCIPWGGALPLFPKAANTLARGLYQSPTYFCSNHRGSPRALGVNQAPN